MLKLIAEPMSRSDARPALEHHLATCAGVSERLARYLEVQHRRETARQEELRLAAELEAIEDAELRDWQEWTRSQERTAPPPSRKEWRDKVLVKLKAAIDARMDLDQAIAGTMAGATELQGQAATLSTQTPAFVEAVLAEEAEGLAARYTEALRPVILIENALLGLRDAAMDRGNGTLVGKINEWLRHGKDGIPLHDGVRQVRANWRALGDRLKTDPQAGEPMP